MTGFLRKYAVNLGVAYAGKTQRELFRRYVDANKLVGFGFHFLVQMHGVDDNASQSKMISMWRSVKARETGPNGWRIASPAKDVCASKQYLWICVKPVMRNGPYPDCLPASRAPQEACHARW